MSTGIGITVLMDPEAGSSQTPAMPAYEQQVLTGVGDAHAANDALNASRNEELLRDEYLRDLGMSAVEFALLWEASGRGEMSSPLTTYETRINSQRKYYERLSSRAGENIGRGTIGGLLYHSVTRPVDMWGNGVDASDARPEYQEGVQLAYRANQARDKGDATAFAQLDTEVGKRLGRKSEAGMFVDFTRNVLPTIEPAENQEYGEAFDEAIVRSAARQAEHDEWEILRAAEVTKELAKMTLQVVGMRADVAAMSDTLTDIYNWPRRIEERRVAAEVQRAVEERARAYTWFENNILLSD